MSQLDRIEKLMIDMNQKLDELDRNVFDLLEIHYREILFTLVRDRDGKSYFAFSAAAFINAYQYDKFPLKSHATTSGALHVNTINGHMISGTLDELVRKARGTIKCQYWIPTNFLPSNTYKKIDSDEFILRYRKA